MKQTKMMKKNYEFKKVLSKGSYQSGQYIEAFIQKTRQNKINLLGIAVSVKLAKAVQRNHIKRLLREVYRKQEDKIEKGYRIVFLWKKKAEITKATFQNIESDMKTIFDKAKISKK